MKFCLLVLAAAVTAAAAASIAPDVPATPPADDATNAVRILQDAVKEVKTDAQDLIAMCSHTDYCIGALMHALTSLLHSPEGSEKHNDGMDVVKVIGDMMLVGVNKFIEAVTTTNAAGFNRREIEEMKMEARGFWDEVKKIGRKIGEVVGKIGDVKKVVEAVKTGAGLLGIGKREMRELAIETRGFWDSLKDFGSRLVEGAKKLVKKAGEVVAKVGDVKKVVETVKKGADLLGIGKREIEELEIETRGLRDELKNLGWKIVDGLNEISSSQITKLAIQKCINDPHCRNIAFPGRNSVIWTGPTAKRT